MARIAQDSTLQAILDFLKSGNKVIDGLSVDRPIAPGDYYVSKHVDVSRYPSIVFSCKASTTCTVWFEFSTDTENWDFSLPYFIDGAVNEVHRLTVSKQYARIRITNSSSAPQQYLRFQALGGQFTQLTSALNSLIQSDQDTIVVRPMDYNSNIAEGLYQNRSPVYKEGFTPSLSSGTGLTQDLWSNGGAYTGFPALAEAGEIVVADADTGTVFYSFMATDTDTDYTIGSISITGPGTYSLGHNIWRSNFAYFNNGSTANVGAITLRHTATPANVFWTIDAGYGQTQCAAYTVPYNSRLQIDRHSGSCRGNVSGAMDGFIWWREHGFSPRLRFAFELQYGGLYFDDIDYLINIPSRTDFVPRITYVSNNNMVGKFTMRYIKIKSQ